MYWGRTNWRFCTWVLACSRARICACCRDDKTKFDNAAEEPGRCYAVLKRRGDYWRIARASIVLQRRGDLFERASVDHLDLLPPIRVCLRCNGIPGPGIVAYQVSQSTKYRREPRGRVGRLSHQQRSCFELCDGVVTRDAAQRGKYARSTHDVQLPTLWTAVTLLTRCERGGSRRSNTSMLGSLLARV